MKRVKDDVRPNVARPIWDNTDLFITADVRRDIKDVIGSAIGRAIMTDIMERLEKDFKIKDFSKWNTFSK